jgi:hypothetical protein
MPVVTDARDLQISKGDFCPLKVNVFHRADDGTLGEPYVLNAFEILKMTAVNAKTRERLFSPLYAQGTGQSYVYFDVPTFLPVGLHYYDITLYQIADKKYKKDQASNFIMVPAAEIPILLGIIKENTDDDVELPIELYAYQRTLTELRRFEITRTASEY